MRRWFGWMMVLALAGCANMQTINRTTSFPNGTGPGKAIHLDAQQRLVLVGKDGKYCAEPSPDALASYASSLGFGVSAPSQGAASVAQALQSAAGSIGLRTQSIQLMRDTLFRICEATANGTLDRLSGTLLLSRSQDLTAVVLAVEQLTGAVVANQVLLTGSAGASASASLLTNQNLLDAAREDELAKSAALDEAKTKQVEAKSARDAALSAEATAKSNYDNAADADRPGLKVIWDAKIEDRKTAEKALSDADTMVAVREQQLADAKKNRETIEASRDAALTSAMATAATAGQFSTPIQVKELSGEATEAIAETVETMVTEVLAKDYTIDACMTMLTAEWAQEVVGLERAVADTRSLCLELIKTKIAQETTRLRAL